MNGGTEVALQDDASFDNSLGFGRRSLIFAPPPAYIFPPEYHLHVIHDIETGYDRHS
jgi:hypothetical protein